MGERIDGEVRARRRQQERLFDLVRGEDAIQLLGSKSGQILDPRRDELERLAVGAHRVQRVQTTFFKSPS